MLRLGTLKESGGKGSHCAADDEVWLVQQAIDIPAVHELAQERPLDIALLIQIPPHPPWTLQEDQIISGLAALLPKCSSCI